MRIKRGDFVRLIVGAHKGVEGQLVKIDHLKKTVFLDEIKVKKHKKPTNNETVGKIVEIHKPIPISNVMALDPSKKILTRIGYKMVKGKKVRFAKKTGVHYND